MHHKYEYPEHTSIAFKIIKMSELSVEVFLLAAHIHTSFQNTSKVAEQRVYFIRIKVKRN